jgi:hypothetical protein
VWLITQDCKEKLRLALGGVHFAFHWRFRFRFRLLAFDFASHIPRITWRF